MKRQSYIAVLLFAMCVAGAVGVVSAAVCGGAQKKGETTALVYTPNGNAHSHNDYRRKRPFWEAYDNGFASMEIDLFLVRGELRVAHTRMGVWRSRTIESLYLKPLFEQIILNGGKAYPDGGRLQLMIEMKTDGGETLRALERLLKPERHCFDVEKNPDAVRVVITGNVPHPSEFPEYDTIFFFDGRAGARYTDEQLARVAFFSAPLDRFTKWRGRGTLPETDRRKIAAFVERIHAMGKKVRFWGNPDTERCWQAFMDLGVDYINTDDPKGLAHFLREKNISLPAENK